MKHNTETYPELREERLVRGLTQVQLRDLSGVPQATITRLERLPGYRAYKTSTKLLRDAFAAFDNRPENSVDAVIQRARMTNISALRERLLLLQSTHSNAYKFIVTKLWPSI